MKRVCQSLGEIVKLFMGMGMTGHGIEFGGSPGVLLIPQMSEWDPCPNIQGIQSFGGQDGPRSHLLLVSDLSEPEGKEAKRRDGQSFHGGSHFLLAPKNSS